MPYPRDISPTNVEYRRVGGGRFSEEPAATTLIDNAPETQGVTKRTGFGVGMQMEGEDADRGLGLDGNIHNTNHAQRRELRHMGSVFFLGELPSSPTGSLRSLFSPRKPGGFLAINGEGSGRWQAPGSVSRPALRTHASAPPGSPMACPCKPRTSGPWASSESRGEGALVHCLYCLWGSSTRSSWAPCRRWEYRCLNSHSPIHWSRRSCLPFFSLLALRLILAGGHRRSRDTFLAWLGRGRAWEPEPGRDASHQEGHGCEIGQQEDQGESGAQEEAGPGRGYG